MSIDQGKLLALIKQARSDYRASDAAGDVLDWLEERALAQPAEAVEVDGDRHWSLSPPEPAHDAAQGAVAGADFTDSSRAALAWVLYHHQGGMSPVGQPIRVALGMGAHEVLQDWRIAEAKRWAESVGAKTSDFHPQAAPAQGDGCWPATKEEMEAYWEAYSAHRVHGEGEAIRAGLAAYQALRAAAPSQEGES